MRILVLNDIPLKSGIGYDLLSSIFQSFGVEYEIHSVLPFMHDKELKKIKPERWLEETDRVLELANGFDKVLCLGSIASSTLFRHPKGVTITKERGRGYLTETGKYAVCTFQPKTIVSDADYFRDLVFDIEKLITNDGPLPQPEVEIIACETVKDLSLLKELHGASFLSCDIETTSLNPYNAEILGIGFGSLLSDDSGYVIVIPQNLIKPQVQKFLVDYKGTVVFHNLKFDIQHIWRKWGRFAREGQYADTMLMNWALDERPFNRYRNHGLDLLQRLYFDAPPKSVSMKAWLEEYFREEPPKGAIEKYLLEFCTEHPEKARTLWREGALPEDHEWRGKKVGRDIPFSVVYPYIPLPLGLRPAPTKARKKEMWDQMLTYMGEDCFSTARLFPVLKARMDEESSRLWNAHVNFDIPASLALANMEMTGAPVDVPYLEKTKKELERSLHEEVLDIRAFVSELTLWEHKNGEEFNPNSSTQVKEILYDKEKGLGLKMPVGVGRYAYKRGEDEVTTNADTLKVLARQVAKSRPAVARLISNLLDFRVRSKILGTYVTGILERVDPDGRVRGDFNLHGTATARISSSNPNLQNIPDASHVGIDVRKAYLPPEGWVLLEADYSQLELRVAALFSQDEVMIEAYKDDADIHQEVAYLLWNKPKDQITKYERYLAKCMNFGVIYGRGARSIATGPEMDNLVDMSGRSWSNKEIDAYFAKFKVGYKQLFDWMALVKSDSLQKQYVENPIGHRRRFDLITKDGRGHIERQIVNTPIQGFAARMTIHALVQLDRKFDPEKQIILFTVHDSIMCACINEPDILIDTALLIKDTMENDLPREVICSLPTLDHSPFKPGDQLVYNLPIVADVTAGKNWGECKIDLSTAEEREHYRTKSRKGGTDKHSVGKSRGT